MSIISALRGLFAPRSYVYRIGAGPTVQVADMGIAELYRTQPNLRAVVSFLAQNAAQVPIKIYERASDNDRIRITDSPAALLLARPNRDTTAYEYRQRVYSDLLLYDRHLSLVMRDADSESGWQLRPIPSSWLRGYEGANPWAPEAVYVANPYAGKTVAVPAEAFVLWHGYDPNDMALQCSPVEALADVLHEQVESNSYRRQMWRNGGRFNAYIRRPAEVEEWTDEQFERFRQTWDESWGGREATQGGKMPILEDGMEIRTVPFSAHDAEWAEAKQLGREDVAGVYHVNPALIWPGSGQTYASARDNARALYNDTLAPWLMQVTDRINSDLMPRIGEPSAHYAEYDLSVKLQGSFEERAQVLQAAVGAPYMTRDEARALLNLPHIDGADELIVPLNVVEGGLASPRDTDPTIDRYSGEAEVKSCGCEACKAQAKTHKAYPPDEASRELAEALKAFYERQSKSVLARIGAGRDDWWDASRWDGELADDLTSIAYRQSEAEALRTIEALGLAPDAYVAKRTYAYIKALCSRRAEMVNETTRAELEEVLAQEPTDDDARTPADVFRDAADNRSESGAAALAVAVAGWSALEAVRQTAPRRGATKTWEVNSGNPRASHAAMNGETVPYSEPFSNGAMWPGDSSVLDAAEVANCQCSVLITLP